MWKRADPYNPGKRQVRPESRQGKREEFATRYTPFLILPANCRFCSLLIRSGNSRVSLARHPSAGATSLGWLIGDSELVPHIHRLSQHLLEQIRNRSFTDF
jgi:hypothetical protein